MTRLPLFLCYALALSAALLVGCGDKQPAPADGHADAHDHDHDHDAAGAHAHESRHGGALVVSSDHAAHFEILHDDQAGTVTLWLYDADLDTVTCDGTPVLNVALESGPVQVQGTTPEGATKAHEWRFAHEALRGHVHEARFRIPLAAETYTPDLPDEHHEDGHDHDHDHEDGK